jgi:hypothetical protein
MKLSRWSITGLALIASCAWSCGDSANDGAVMQQTSGGAGGMMVASGGAGAGGAPVSGGAGGTVSSGGIGGAGGTVSSGGIGGSGGGVAGSSGGMGGSGGTMVEPTPEVPFDGADFVTWSTEEFSLEPGQERYLCFASSLDEDLVINGYNTLGGQPYVHHLIFARTRTPEPEGFEECDVAFRNSWDTLFITGAGASTLEFPEDAGHQLPTGTQLLVQMHLLNATEQAVSGSLDINMRRSSIEKPRPVSSFIFGTAAVELPPSTTSEVVGTCPMWQAVDLIAGFPHMHMLGTSMRFEVGSSEADLREVFKREPFNFDDQRIDPLELSIAAGSITRVSCTYDNPHDETIGYGESSFNEMCYFVGFAVDRPGMSACLEVLPPF